MKTIVLNKPAHKCFDDIATSLTEVEYDGTVCFGVQDWSIGEIQDVLSSILGRKICYQLEVLDGKTYYSNQEYIEKLKMFDEIWEYSEYNIPYLVSNGVNHIVYKPVMPSKSLKKEKNIEKDIDILHFGQLNSHRIEYLNYAIKEGFSICDVISHFEGDVYGEKLHNLILRSKVVLGLHSFPNMPIQEAVRYQYPLSNNITVLAEKSIANPLDLLEFETKEEMVQRLKELLPPISKNIKVDIKISILMPVYNAEDTLSKSISSVINQTYSHWELICIDDGSTDNSLKLLNDWKSKDDRIKVLTKKNEGPAKARAFGMEIATGVYYIFLDSDDEFGKDILEKALETISKTKADAVCPNLIQQNSTGKYKDNFIENSIIANSVISGKEAFVKSLTWAGVHSLLLCRADVFKSVACDKDFLYGNFNSDELITRALLLKLNKLAFSSGEYFYHYNPNSITKKFSPKLFGYLQTNIKLIQLAEKYQQPDEVIVKIESNSFREMIDLFYLFFSHKKELVKEDKKKINQLFHYYYSELDKTKLREKLKNRGITQKIQRVVLLSNYSICRSTLWLVNKLFAGKKIYKKVYHKLYPNFGV